MPLLARRGRHSPIFFLTVLTCTLFRAVMWKAVMWKTLTHPSLSIRNHRWLIANHVATLKMSSFMKQISTVCTANQIFPHCGLCGAVLPEGNNAVDGEGGTTCYLKSFFTLCLSSVSANRARPESLGHTIQGTRRTLGSNPRGLARMEWEWNMSDTQTGEMVSDMSADYWNMWHQNRMNA